MKKLCILLIFFLSTTCALNDKDNTSTTKTSVPEKDDLPVPSEPPTTKSPPMDTSPCKQNRGPLNGTLPQLDDQFQAHIEVTFAQKNYTMDVIEYYDWQNNRGAVFTTKNGEQSRVLYEYPSTDVFFVIKGKECLTQQASNPDNEGFDFFNFTVTAEGSGHIANVKDLFRLGSKYNTTYEGKTQVRGIPVERWSSCLTWERHAAVFEVDYFFSQATHSSPAGQRPVPVRMTVIGKGSGQGTTITFNHTYEFTSYRPGPIQDPSVFEVPRGLVCQGNHTKKRPKLPDHFSAGVEVVDNVANYTTIRMEYYNFPGNLSRFDYHPAEGESVDERYRDRPLRVIHDYSSGIEYVIDAIRESCWMHAIPSDAIDGTPTENHVQMKNGAQLFDLNSFTFFYQGRHTVRDIPCDVWAAKAVNYTGAGITTTVEVYFMQDQNNWRAQVLDKSDTAAFVGLWMQSVDTEGSMIGERSSHVFSYYPGQPSMDHFDIRNCYQKAEDMKHIIFRLHGSYHAVVINKLLSLRNAVRNYVAAAAKVEAVRIQDIYFDSTNSQYVDVWLTLLEKPSIAGSVESPVFAVSSEEAFVLLKEAIDRTGLNITYNSVSGDNVTVLAVNSSLKTSQEAYDPRSLPKPLIAESGSGYSSGSMAALGVCMLLIGIAAGLGGAYYLWRRSSPVPGGVPYRIQT